MSESVSAALKRQIADAVKEARREERERAARIILSHEQNCTSKVDPLIMPFELGAEYWLPSTSPRQVIEACPVCAGKKLVTVMAGEEQFVVDCDACGLGGYQGPQGVVTVYHYDPHAEPFTIADVVRLDDEGWTVKDAAGKQARFKTLCATQEEALAVSQAAHLAQEEHNMRQRDHRRKGVSKAAWTVRYHTDAIKKLERELAYHRGKLNAKP